mmetsp:Transcript_50788/g.145766  ORF Transcript_50788/g.145766 Transcript_50788/m.145766 type:complete len:243 (-) Transcript_50788:403-1131(-)
MVHGVAHQRADVVRHLQARALAACHRAGSGLRAQSRGRGPALSALPCLRHGRGAKCGRIDQTLPLRWIHASPVPRRCALRVPGAHQDEFDTLPMQGLFAPLRATRPDRGLGLAAALQGASQQPHAAASPGSAASAEAARDALLWSCYGLARPPLPDRRCPLGREVLTRGLLAGPHDHQRRGGRLGVRRVAGVLRGHGRGVAGTRARAGDSHLVRLLALALQRKLQHQLPQHPDEHLGADAKC